MEKKIPTLEEALVFLKGRMMISIEVKQFGKYYPGIEEAVLSVIQKTNTENQVYVISFDHYCIQRIRELSSTIRIGVLLEGASSAIFPYLKKIHATYLVVKRDYLIEVLVETCNKFNIQLVVWPVNTESHMGDVSLYSNVLCTTDELERFKGFI